MVLCAPCIAAAAAPSIVSSTGVILTTGAATLAGTLGIKKFSNKIKTRKRKRTNPLKKKKKKKPSKKKKTQRGGRKHRTLKGGKKKFIRQNGGSYSTRSKVSLPGFYVEHI